MTAPSPEPDGVPGPPRPPLSRDVRVAVALTILVIPAAVVSYLLSNSTMWVARQVCPTNCQTQIDVAVGVMYGGIVAAVLLGVLGIHWASRRASRVWPWPAGALLLIVVSAAVGPLIAPSPTPPASQRQAQDTVLRYLQQTVDAMPPGSSLDGRRLAVGDGVSYCQDNPSGPDAPVSFSDWRDVDVPEGTVSGALVAQIGEVWRSWGWDVIERNGFPKPNRFGYAPDGYTLQIEVRSDPNQSLSLIGGSPCFPGSLKSKDTPRNPEIIVRRG